MASVQSVLDQVLVPGHHGQVGDAPQLVLQERRIHALQQVAVWADTVQAVEQRIVKNGAFSEAPALSNAIINATGQQLIRTEPLKWWLLSHDASAPDTTEPEAPVSEAPIPGLPALEASEGVVLDLSHARVQLDISGPAVRDYLNRYLAVDLREARCPAGRVYTTQLHHTSVTLICHGESFSLLLLSSFAQSLAALLVSGAAQFGYEVLPPE